MPKINGRNGRRGNCTDYRNTTHMISLQFYALKQGGDMEEIIQYAIRIFAKGWKGTASVCLVLLAYKFLGHLIDKEFENPPPPVAPAVPTSSSVTPTSRPQDRIYVNNQAKWQTETQMIFARMNSRSDVINRLKREGKIVMTEHGLWEQASKIHPSSNEAWFLDQENKDHRKLFTLIAEAENKRYEDVANDYAKNLWRQWPPR